MTDDRSAVVTTMNGHIVEWKVFDDPAHAMDHYTKEVDRLRDFLQHSSEEDAWEIMLCDVRQYALSKPHGKEKYTHEEGEWYSRSLRAVADRAKRMKDLRPQWNLHVWNHTRDQSAKRSRREEEPLRSL